MKKEILNFVINNTFYKTLDEVSTKQVAAKFGITTKQAYVILNELAGSKKITKLPPVNGQNLDCCGWIENDREKEDKISETAAE